MITKSHLIFDILNVYRGGKQSDDENISERQVGFWIDNTRALLLKRELDKDNYISSDLVQTLGCVPIELVDASECGCVTVGCKILRTVDRIPNLIEGATKTYLTRVGPIQIGSAPFSLIPYERAQWEADSRYKVTTKVFLHNGYIYIIPPDNKLNLMKYISISGIFENPEDVANFVDCPGGNACYTDESPYPLTAWMVEPLKEIVFKNNLNLAARTPSDNSGNANHDIEPNTTK